MIELGVLLHVVIELLLIARVMLKPGREPISRVAWITVVATLPGLGLIIYLLFGEVNIGKRRIERRKEVKENFPKMTYPASEGFDTAVPARYQSLFNVARSISGFEPVGGNIARLMEDSNATIDAMVADIDQAKDHVHLMFYIWLADNNGCKVAEALKRAVRRGVVCRAMADSLGSRLIIASPVWKDMIDSGILLFESLRIGNPLTRPLVGRIDLRDHQKILVVDGRITYFGSQNCADPEFRTKPKYAPWVDCVIRFEGPIAQQAQQLFAMDWSPTAKEDIGHLLTAPVKPLENGFFAQAFGTGPTVRYSALPEMFASMIYLARDELIVTTPYYVPDESLHRALCSAAYRGVKTTLIVPAKNDSWVVRRASCSYYSGLLAAGVALWEYQGGLLHSKTMTIDSDATLIGSANLDRRSFELNFENNVVFYNPQLTAEVRTRQLGYIDSCRQVTQEIVDNWSLASRFINNSLGVLAPIL